MTSISEMNVAPLGERAESIEVVLSNPCGLPRMGWVKVAIPANHPMAYRPWVFYRPWRGADQIAIRTKWQGDASVIFQLWSVWQPGEKEQRGDLVDEWNPAVRLPDSPAVDPSLDISAVLLANLSPFLDVYDSQDVRVNAVERVTKIQGKAGAGWWWESWETQKAFTRTIDVAWRMTWSDRTSTKVDNRVFQPKLTSAHPFVIHHAPLNGMQRVATWNANHGRFEAMIGNDLGVVDGGSIFGWATVAPQSLQEGESEELLEDDPIQESIRADLTQPLYGCCAQWPSGRYLTAYTPKVNDGAREQAQRMIDSHQSAIESGVVKDFYAPRPLGLSPNAGSTGAQQAFGAVKGSALVWGMPGWIPLLQYSFMDPVRGTDHRDEDGDRITKDTNPQFYTWSGRLNPRWPGVDSLGKPFSETYRWGAYTANRPVSGGDAWTGIDDQHRSNSVAVQLLHWTGDDMVEDCMVSQIEADRCMIDGRIGAPRAVGRLMQSWAELLMVMPREHGERLVPRINEKWGNVVRASGMQKPVRTIETKVDARMGIVNGGEVQRAWSVWEHGLAVVGVAAMARVKRLLSDYGLALPGIEVFAAVLANSVTEYGVWRNPEDNFWDVLATAYYNDGQPLPDPGEGWMRLNSAGSGVGLWVMPAVMYSASLGNPRAQEIAQDLAYFETSMSQLDVLEWKAVAVRHGEADPWKEVGRD
jgi:hypothetical protein